MITYINELIIDLGLAKGNARWPPVLIKEDEFTKEGLNSIDKLKNQFNIKGYN